MLLSYLYYLDIFYCEETMLDLKVYCTSSKSFSGSLGKAWCGSVWYQ